MNVLYEDNSILVVEKPAGIAVQTAGVASKSIETECKKYRKSKGEPAEIFVVHRLDQPVSGILLLAKTKEAAAVLSKGIKDDSFAKDYKAVVYSNGKKLKGKTLTDYIVKDSKTNMAKIVPEGSREGKKAVLDLEVINESEKETELLVHLQTGRFHQIRVQLSHMGTPILGDRKYGTVESIAYSDELGLRNVSLTACYLSFAHPVTGKTMEFNL